MTAIKYTTSLKPAWKFVLYACCIFTAAVSLDLVLSALIQSNFIVDQVKEDAKTWVILFFSLVFLAAVLSMVYTYFYELIIDEKGITKKGFFNTYSIAYEEVDEIFVDVMLVAIKSQKKKVSIGTQYSDYKEIIAYIGNQIEDRMHSIRFKGKAKRIERFFPDAEAEK